MDCPGEKDVLCGNVNAFVDHLGNRRFRTLVDIYIRGFPAEIINGLAPSDPLVMEIMDVLRVSGYRFLRFNASEVFEEVDNVSMQRAVLSTMSRRIGSNTQRLDLHLKAVNDLKRDQIDVVKYAESLTPWHQQDAWKPEWRMARFKFGARSGTNTTSIEHLDKHGPNASASIYNNKSRKGLGEKDVVIGRDGTLIHGYGGNSGFHFILDSYQQAYKDASKGKQKISVINKVISFLDKDGYRFLRVDSTGDNVPLMKDGLATLIAALMCRCRQQHEGMSRNRLKRPSDSDRIQDQPPTRKYKRYIAAINDIVVPAMKNGVLPLKGYWKFFPLPELGPRIDLGSTPVGWKLRLEPIAFVADSIVLEVPSTGHEALEYEGLSS